MATYEILKDGEYDTETPPDEVPEIHGDIGKKLINTFNARYVIKKVFINSNDLFKVRVIKFILKTYFPKEVHENIYFHDKNNRLTLNPDYKFTNSILLIDLDVGDVYDNLIDTDPTIFIVKSDGRYSAFEKLFLVSDAVYFPDFTQFYNLFACDLFESFRRIWNNTDDMSQDDSFIKNGLINDPVFDIKFFNNPSENLEIEYLTFLRLGKLTTIPLELNNIDVKLTTTSVDNIEDLEYVKDFLHIVQRGDINMSTEKAILAAVKVLSLPDEERNKIINIIKGI